MCELLAFNFNQPISPLISFKPFSDRSRIHRDGWGLAWFIDSSPQIIKEPKQASSSSLAEFLASYKEIKSQNIISHIRIASEGGVSFSNTHPFSRELNGKHYVFAHNGTLNKDPSLSSDRFIPVGQTDSELAFCYLLSQIDLLDNNMTSDPLSFFSELEAILNRINEFGKFNCLFSDGEYLFAYHTNSSSFCSLHELHRKPPYDMVNYSDDDYSIDLSEKKNSKERGFLIATNKLSDENWTEFDPGQLRVYKDGIKIFPRSEEKSSIQVEVQVYDSSAFLDDLNRNNTKKSPIIGLPLSVRQALSLELGDRVKISSSSDFLICYAEKSDRRLVTFLPNVDSFHIMIPPSQRQALGLSLQSFRVADDAPDSFNQQFGHVTLSKYGKSHKRKT